MENTAMNTLPAPGMGYPNYPQPEVGHLGPAAANYQNPPLYHQQQQQAAMNNQPIGVAQVVVVGAPPVSMVGAIVLSCFVFLCCGWLLGGIAFALAMLGQSSAGAGDTRGAIQMRKASYILSIAGIGCGIIIIIVVASIYGSAANQVAFYPYHSICYKYGPYGYPIVYYC